MVAYRLYVAIDATPNTGKKTSKIVDFLFPRPLYEKRFYHLKLRCEIWVSDKDLGG